MTQNVVEVNNINDANYVYIVDDHRKIGFTDGRYYKLHDRYGSKYAIDNNGKENAGVLCVVKTRLYQIKNKEEVNHLIEEVKQSKVANSRIDFCYENMLETMFELFSEIKSKSESELSDTEHHFKYRIQNYLDALGA